MHQFSKIPGIRCSEVKRKMGVRGHISNDFFFENYMSVSSKIDETLRIVRSLRCVARFPGSFEPVGLRMILRM